MFRIQAILHDSARSENSTMKKGPGYCYVAPSLPSSGFPSSVFSDVFGHVTGLIFC